MRRKRISESAILRKIKDTLVSHKGAKDGITSRELAAALGIVEGDTFIRTRSYVDKAIRLYGLPIGATTSGGYFFITTQSELFEYLGSLEGRIFEIKNKKKIVYENFVKHYGEPTTAH